MHFFPPRVFDKMCSCPRSFIEIPVYQIHSMKWVILSETDEIKDFPEIVRWNSWFFCDHWCSWFSAFVDEIFDFLWSLMKFSIFPCSFDFFVCIQTKLAFSRVKSTFSPCDYLDKIRVYSHNCFPETRIFICSHLADICYFHNPKFVSLATTIWWKLINTINLSNLTEILVFFLTIFLSVF